jgi:lysophospholipase L1-like esterase
LLPAGSPVVGLGVIGDSLSDEYAGELHGYAKNWVELLAQNRGVNLGAWGKWAEPRREGYEFDWARNGATSQTALSAGQHTGLARQVRDHRVSHVVVAIGQNDFFLGSSAYVGIYSGAWSDSRITKYSGQVLKNIRTVLDTLAPTGAKVVLSNVIDYGVAPLTRFLYSSADRRDRVANVISRLNTQIAGLARTYHVPLVDAYGFTKNLLGTNHAPVLSHQIGGQTFVGRGGILARNEFVFDQVHPHTVPQAIFANLFATSLNRGYGTNIRMFSERDMVSLVGLRYGGRDTLPIAYSRYVVLPPAKVGASVAVAAASDVLFAADAAGLAGTPDRARSRSTSPSDSQLSNVTVCLWGDQATPA